MMMMMMMTVHNLQNVTFQSCLRRPTSSTSPCNELNFLFIRHSSEIRSMCLWIEVLSVFMGNPSTFGVIRDISHITTNDIVMRRTTSRMTGLKLARSPTVLQGFCGRIKTHY